MQRQTKKVTYILSRIFTVLFIICIPIWLSDLSISKSVQIPHKDPQPYSSWSIVGSEMVATTSGALDTLLPIFRLDRHGLPDISSDNFTFSAGYPHGDNDLGNWDGQLQVPQTAMIAPGYGGGGSGNAGHNDQSSPLIGEYGSTSPTSAESISDTKGGSGTKDNPDKHLLIDRLYHDGQGHFIALFNPNTYQVRADTHYFEIVQNETIKRTFVPIGLIDSSTSSVFEIPTYIWPSLSKRIDLYEGTTTRYGIKILPHRVDFIECDDCAQVSFTKYCPTIAAQYRFNRVNK